MIFWDDIFVTKSFPTDTFFGLKICQEMPFRPGLRPGPHWESVRRSPDPLAAFQGPTSKGRGLREGKGTKGEEKEWERRWEGKRKGGSLAPPNLRRLATPLHKSGCQSNNQYSAVLWHVSHARTLVLFITDHYLNHNIHVNVKHQLNNSTQSRRQTQYWFHLIQFDSIPIRFDWLCLLHSTDTDKNKTRISGLLSSMSPVWTVLVTSQDCRRQKISKQFCLFSKLDEDYWKQSWFVANSVHNTDVTWHLQCVY